MFHSAHIKCYKICKDITMDEDLNSDNWYILEYVSSTIKNSRTYIDLEYISLHFTELINYVEIHLKKST